MIEREREDRVAAREGRVEPEPPVPVGAGTREWASAVGSAAVARLARQRMVAREEAEDEGMEEPQAEAEEAPEGMPELEDLPEDGLPA